MPVTMAWLRVDLFGGGHERRPAGPSDPAAERVGVKLIQVCASYNNLFGLDEDGQPYTYKFHTNTWTRLGPLQSDGTTERAARAIDTR
jgi:hypothetical protein